MARQTRLWILGAIVVGLAAVALFTPRPESDSGQAKRIASAPRGDEPHVVVPESAQPIDDEPRYLGRNAAAWLEALDGDSWERAEWELHRGGEAAVSVLRASLASLSAEDFHSRDQVLRVLTSLGPEAAVALPEMLEQLIERYEDEETLNESTARTLSRLPPHALPHLIRALADERPLIRAGVAAILRDMGERARPAGEALCEALGDEDDRVRMWAARALGELGGRNEAAAELLERRLTDESWAVRVFAAGAHWKLARDADVVLPVLMSALECEEYWVVREAVTCLGAMGPAAREAGPGLVDTFRWGGLARNRMSCIGALPTDPAGDALVSIGGDFGLGVAENLSSEVSEWACRSAYCVGEMVPATHALAPQFSRALRDPRLQVKQAALRGLISSFPADDAVSTRQEVPEEVWRAVERGTRDPCGGVRYWALKAHGRVRGEDAVPVLVDALRSGDEDLRSAAAEYLGEMGPAARTAVPALLEMIEQTRGDERSRLIRTLGAIGPGAADSVPVLIGLEDPEVADAVCAALSRIAPESEATLDFVLKHLDTDPEPWAAVWALRIIGDRARAALPALESWLSRAEIGWDRTQLARAIRSLTGKSQPLLDICMRGLEDPEVRGREEAARALGELGVEAAEAVSLLRERLWDPDDDVREAARDALAAIEAD